MPMDHETMAMPDLNWEFLRWNALRSTKRKLFYVATPKVACTTLKWWFARLDGYSVLLNANAEESKETAPELIIHDTLHKVAPELTGLLPEALAEALQSDEYFRFALVRNPFKRIFSAWQSKVLLREPLQVAPYLDKPFYGYPIVSRADIAKAFEVFLEHLASEEAPTFWDVHWTPQVDLLRPDAIEYTSLSKIEDVSELEKLLRDRLGGGVASPFAARLSNESLIPYREEFISERSAQLIRTLYSDDFEGFGYDMDLPRAKESFSPTEFDLAMRAVNMIRARHERISAMRIVAERKVHDLQLEAAGKSECLNTLQHVVTDSVSQHAQLQRQGLDAIDAQLDEFRSVNLRALERERELAEALVRMESLGKHATRLEAEHSQLSDALAHTAASRARLQDKLDFVMASARELRVDVAHHLPRDDLPSKEWPAPVDERAELEGLRMQIEPLLELPSKIEVLNQLAVKFGSLRFLLSRFFAILWGRLAGRRF